MSNEKQNFDSQKDNKIFSDPSAASDLIIEHCEKCNELTPQIDNNTTGTSCQVCLHSNSYVIKSQTPYAAPEWIATFWQHKYNQDKWLRNANKVIVMIDSLPCNNY